jgi:hypothetical protein
MPKAGFEPAITASERSKLFMPQTARIVILTHNILQCVMYSSMRYPHGRGLWVVSKDYNNLKTHGICGKHSGTALIMKSSVFWDITLCSPLKVCRWFGGTYLLHLQGWWISQTIKQHEVSLKLSSLACFLLQAGILLGLLSDTEGNTCMFLRNFVWR